MINVVYYRDFCRVTLRGHANAGDFGEDLVCAAASILAQTLAADVERLEKGGQVRDVQLRLEPGDGEIGCTPGSKYRAVTRLVFDSVCAGFEILAAKSPEFIFYEIHGS